MRFFREGRTAAVAFEKIAGTSYHGVPATITIDGTNGIRGACFPGRGTKNAET